MQEKEKNNRRLRFRSALRRAARIYALVAMFLVFTYIEVGVILKPDSFIEQWKSSYADASAQVGLAQRIYEMPDIPDVQISKGCNDEGSFVRLEWQDDDDAISYTIKRDDRTIRRNTYSEDLQDDGLKESERYEYTVRANGAFGTVTSDVVSIMTSECESTKDEPYIIIQAINQVGRWYYHDDVRSQYTQPSFAGKSNVERGKVYITLTNEPYITATTKTWKSGYWEWYSPLPLTSGRHTIAVVVVNEDGVNSAPEILEFEVDLSGDVIIVDRSDDEDVTVSDGSLDSYLGSVNTCFLGGAECSELQLEASVLNDGRRVVEGRELDVSVLLKNLKDTTSFVQDPQFIIYDSKGDERYRIQQKLDGLINDMFSGTFSLPSYLEPGEYSVQAAMVEDGRMTTAQDDFLIIEAPLVHLGGGITYTKTDVVSKLGWIVLITLVGLLMFLLVMLAEYSLYVMSQYHLNGKHLKRTGNF